MVESKRAIDAKPKNAAAVELGRLGGRAGGQARAAVLTPERRVRIARQAALKRWAMRGAESAQRGSGGRPHKTELESRILATATKMYADRGFHAMTMRDVAREARVGLSEGPQRIYAFAYAYCRIQSDPAFPKLIHRQLLDKDLGVLKPLAEGVFLQQFVELRKSVALIVGNDKADFVTFAIFATGFGLIRLSPFSEYIAALSGTAGNPEAIARGTLSLLFPGVNWDAIACSLEHRLGVAYSP
jgi:hypothetical protein